jgi:phosphoribosylglycinamide formyltransferase-1
MTKLGVLISGRGSNLRAIHRATLDGTLEAEVVCVISNVPEAAGIAWAEAEGLPAYRLRSKGVAREEFDKELVAILERHQVDLVCLAGYMRLLSAPFIERFRGRILNIHPSLLPAFPGMNGIEEAYAAGVRETGCTVHHVDEGLDTGPVLLQERVAVEPGDTIESLAERIHAAEHRLYPAAIARWILDQTVKSS